jgi:DNA-binding NtrC family response regulator
MENVIRRAVLYCQRGVLAVQDLPSSIRTATTGMMSGNFPSGPRAYPNDDEMLAGPALPASMGARLQAPPAAVPQNSLPMQLPYLPAANREQATVSLGASSLGASRSAAAVAAPPASRLHPSLEARVDVLERRIIEDCLHRNNHRRKETAAELGISRVTLYNKMKKFGLM